MFEMTDTVVVDINTIVGTKYDAAELAEHVSSCFSQFSAADAACGDCKIQLACAIYTGERKGLAGLRDSYVTGKPDAVPPGLKAELVAVNRRLPKPAMVSPPPMFSDDRVGRECRAEPTPPDVAPPLVEAVAPPLGVAPEVEDPPYPYSEADDPESDEPETVEPPEALSVEPVAPPLAPTAPSPDALMAAASPIAVDGGPPAGWPDIPKEQLLKLCFALGYTEKNVFHKRAIGLVRMIIKKRPKWESKADEAASPKKTKARAKAESVSVDSSASGASSIEWAENAGGPEGYVEQAVESMQEVESPKIVAPLLPPLQLVKPPAKANGNGAGEPKQAAPSVQPPCPVHGGCSAHPGEPHKFHCPECCGRVRVMLCKAEVFGTAPEIGMWLIEEYGEDAFLTVNVELEAPPEDTVAGVPADAS